MSFKINRPFRFRTAYPAVNTLITVLFSVYVITWYLELGKRIAFLGSIRFEWILGLVLFVLVLITGGFNLLSDDNRLFYAISFLYLTVIINVFHTQDFDNSYEIFVDRFVKFSFMFLFIHAFVKSPFQLKIFIAVFLLACMKIGQEGFVGKITGSMVWENQGVMRLNGAPGTLYGHPNSLSGNALGTLPFIYFLFPIVSKTYKIAITVLLIFSINIIIFTGSRTGYVGFTIFVIFLIWKSKRRWKALLVAACIGIIAVPMIPKDYIERFMTIATQKDKEGGSINARKEINRDALEIFKEYPFGVGVFAFPKVRIKMFGRFQDVHNMYLEIMTNLGIQGGIAFILFIYYIYLYINYIQSRVKTDIGKIQDLIANIKENLSMDEIVINQYLEDLKFMDAICNAIKGFVLIRLVLGVFGMDFYEIYWWFASGLALALYKMSAVNAQRTKEIFNHCQGDMNGHLASSFSV